LWFKFSCKFYLSLYLFEIFIGKVKTVNFIIAVAIGVKNYLMIINGLV